MPPLERALAASGGDRARARSLAEAARDGLKAQAQLYGSFYADKRTAIDAWLATAKR